MTRQTFDRRGAWQEIAAKDIAVGDRFACRCPAGSHHVEAVEPETYHRVKATMAEECELTGRRLYVRQRSNLIWVIPASDESTGHVDGDVADQVAGASRLRGPIAYLNRGTEEPGSVRRIETLTIPSLPLVLARRPLPGSDVGHFGAVPVGQLTAVEVIDEVVWADATMETADPHGTRYPVGIDLAHADVTHLDESTGREISAETLMFSTRPAITVFHNAELMGATIEDPPARPAWPDAYLEVTGPWT